MTRKALIDRWNTTERSGLSMDVASRLIAGRPLDGLGLERHEGRWDLRGFALPDPVRLGASSSRTTRLGGAFELTKARLTGIDLSHARLQSLRFDRAEITDCVFDDADCRDWRLWDSTVRSSSFRAAKLRGAMLSGYEKRKGSTWAGVDFSNADLIGNTIEAAELSDCTFANAKLKGVHFDASTLVRCHFEGELVEVRFDCRPVKGLPKSNLAELDLTRTTLVDVEFWGAGLGSVRFPDDPALVVVPRFNDVLRRQLKLIEGDDSRPARIVRRVSEGLLRGPQNEKADGLFNRRDFEQSGEDVGAFAEETLRRAMS